MYSENLHVDSKLFYELMEDAVPLKWTREHKKLLQNNKGRNSEETIVAVANPKYPFHIHVTSSSIGSARCILVKEFPSGKRIVSFTSRVYTKNEQKMSTLHPELRNDIRFANL